MKHYLFSIPFLLLLFVSNPGIFAQTTDAYSTNSYSGTVIPTFTDSEIKERLSKLTSAVAPPRFTPAVRSYIRTYTVKKRQHTEAMLGRTTMYFPMFEKYLSEKNLPVDLKYLSVVESALNPKAVSRSGAVGLWQFMPPTGREQGLKINSTVDERKDPHKSTKAAMKYLERQYKKYNNWELALAAYNGGPGRVNRAIKRGRSKNFWRIQRYLPKETRNYVPAFIAATYILNYYTAHNLVPQYPDIDLQLTELIKIYKKISFYEIEQMTGAPMHIIETLNPSYKKKYIPNNRKGNNLVLPQQYMSNLVAYLGRPDSEIKRINAPRAIPAPQKLVDYSEGKHTVVHTVFNGDTFESIANYYGVTADDVKLWNQHRGYYLNPGRELSIYVPKLTNNHRFVKLASLPTLSPNPVFSNLETTQELDAEETKAETMETTVSVAPRVMPKLKFIPTKFVEDDGYLYYLIGRDETISDIANQYHGVTVNGILSLNEVKDVYSLKPGQKIKLKRK